MRHASLFSGIGGFDLAAKWMGWENVFHCEIDPFCQRVLKYHFPTSIPHHDIKQTDFTQYAKRIDILTGGFPCQPYSSAGLRLGTEDERHLWPQMLRAIREIRPCYIVGENVRGIINWNGGMVFDEVQANLEAEGYEVLPFLLPSCAKDYDHERFRTWFIAHSNKDRLHKDKIQSRFDHENYIRFDREQFKSVASNSSQYIPNSRPHGTNNGLPNGLDECRLSGLGNAISPSIAFEIFKAINKYEIMIAA